MASEQRRCKAEVREPDTYRYHGGTPRFGMHYTRSQCKRRAAEDNRCRQHAKPQFVDYDYATDFMEGVSTNSTELEGVK